MSEFLGYPVAPAHYKFSACPFLQSRTRAIVGGPHWWHTVAYMARGMAFKSLPLRTDSELNISVGISNLTSVSWNCDLPFLRNEPAHTGPGAYPAAGTVGTGSFPGVNSGRGVTLTPYPLLVPWPRKSRAITTHPMGRTACRPTESQCLYKGALYLPCFSVRELTVGSVFQCQCSSHNVNILSVGDYWMITVFFFTRNRARSHTVWLQINLTDFVPT